MANLIRAKWKLGFRDRGLGRGDFAVITGKGKLVVECPDKAIAEHIIKLHNAKQNEKKKIESLTILQVSPGIPSWATPLPATLHVGRRIKVVNGTWVNWEGIVKSHYICGDDCSGMYGKHKYEVEKDTGERFSILVENCICS